MAKGISMESQNKKVSVKKVVKPVSATLIQVHHFDNPERKHYIVVQK